MFTCNRKRIYANTSRDILTALEACVAYSNNVASRVEVVVVMLILHTFAVA